MSFKNTVLVFSLVILAAGSGRAAGPDFIIGADLTPVPQQEEWTWWRDFDSTWTRGLELFRKHAYNWVRLNLFHNPENSEWELPYDLEYNIALAAEAKAMGYRVLLDYHFSDTWANPGNQDIPAAWKGLDLDGLKDSVYEYTRSTIEAFREAGGMPDMVQLGNEITCGLLWPMGKTCGSGTSWWNYGELMKSARSGVEAGTGSGTMPKIMIHIDKGGKQSSTKSYFDNVRDQGIPYDIIGQSFYPRWNHGSLPELKSNLEFMANEYGKEIIIVETMFGFYNNDSKNDLISALDGSAIPYTDSGQVRFYKEIYELIENTPNGLGKGFFSYFPTQPDHGVWPYFDTVSTGERMPKPILGAFDDKALGFITQPRDTAVTEGAPVWFYAGAAGLNLTYQWQQNGIDVPGATFPTYNLFMAQPYDNDAEVRVIITNANGSDTSRTARLTVLQKVGTGGPAAEKTGTIRLHGLSKYPVQISFTAGEHDIFQFRVMNLEGAVLFSGSETLTGRTGELLWKGPQPGPGILLYNLRSGSQRQTGIISTHTD